MDIQTDDTKRKRFLWGVCLAWTPFLFFIPTVISAFNGIAREKVTGLAVVAGLDGVLLHFRMAAILVLKWRQLSCCCAHSLEATRHVPLSQ